MSTATLPPGSTLGQIRQQLVTTATADTALGKRVRALLAELDDIRVDRAMAARMNRHTTGRWLGELATEERRTWRELRAVIGTRESN